MANKFMGLLMRSNAKIRQDRATYVSKAASMSAQKYLMNLEGKRNALELAISQATDLSASNDTNIDNALTSFESEGWIHNLIQNKLKLRVINEELQEANKVCGEFFSDDDKIDPAAHDDDN